MLASGAVARGLSGCVSWALDIGSMFLDQGTDLRLQHWQVDSLPLSHQGSPPAHFESRFYEYRA